MKNTTHSLKISPDVPFGSKINIRNGLTFEDVSLDRHTEARVGETKGTELLGLSQRGQTY